MMRGKEWPRRFTPPAERQIDKLHDHISAHGGEERADGDINRIMDCCRGFAALPERGTMRDLRVAGFESRAISAFVVRQDAVLIDGHFDGGAA